MIVKVLRKVSIGLMLLSGSIAYAEPDLLFRLDVQRYIDERVAQDKMSRSELEAFFANVEMKPNIIQIMDKPSTSRPYYQFRPNFMTETTIQNGVNFWQKHAKALVLAEQTYQVPAAIIVAIIGIETGYGRNVGNIRIADALTTLAFNYPRRAEFFRSELTELLKLSKEEYKNPLSLKGSYAGAMGLPQFMPSSFRKWAVDFDKDGNKDIWTNPVDAIGSVANYFKIHGWRYGDDVVIPASAMPGAQTDKLTQDKFNLHYTVKDLKAWGIVPQGEVKNSVKAVLFPLENQAGQIDYYLGLNNFYVITRYNKSTLYAMVTNELSLAIRDRYMSQAAYKF